MSLILTSSSSRRGTTSASESVQTTVTAKQAIHQIRHQMKSCLRIAIYSFNVGTDELESAYTLLDKLEGRKSMRITYNGNYDFIVKYMPSPAHEVAHTLWNRSLTGSLLALTGRNDTSVLGCVPLGATTFTLSAARKKQADACVCPDGANSPTVVIEVGASETLEQLQLDAKLWLESDLLNVELVIIICIDPPPPPYPNFPQITIQHWKSFPPSQQTQASSNAQRKVGSLVWQDDWTYAVTPNYFVPLADIFTPAAIPPIYGGATQAVFSTAALAHWRQQIINRWH